MFSKEGKHDKLGCFMFWKEGKHDKLEKRVLKAKKPCHKRGVLSKYIYITHAKLNIWL